MKFECAECGEEVERFPSQVQERVFCSHKCREEYYRRHMKKDKKERVKIMFGIEYEADELKIRLRKKRL